MTGKTTLAQLLEQHLLQSNEVKEGLCRVFRISLIWMDDLELGSSWKFADGFKDLMNVTWFEFVKQCGERETILIVDEVQKIYKPQNEEEPRHGGNVFWNTFKHIAQTTRLHIVAFASYGHYGAYTSHGEHGMMDISPCKLEPSSTWGFEDVRFTREEFSEYFNRFCGKNLRMLKAEDSPLLSSYVSEITGLHPGLVAFTLNEIHTTFIKRTFEPLTFARVFAYLKSFDFNNHFKVT